MFTKRLYLLVLFLFAAIASSCVSDAQMHTRVHQGIYVHERPPEMRVEIRGEAPSAEYVWTDGYWGYYNHAYAWSPGQWVIPPSPRAVWHNHGWVHNSSHSGYHFNPGHWGDKI